MPYLKLDTGILDSSLWYNFAERNVFLTALLMAYPKKCHEPMPQIEVRSLKETGFVAPPGDYGFIEAAGTGLVRRSLLEEEEGLDALERLGQPDPESRSNRFEGRRLIRVDGGYLALNYESYRNKDHTTAARSARYRQRVKGRDVTRDATLPALRHAVTPRGVTQAEAEAEAEADPNALSPDGERGTGERARSFSFPSEQEVLFHADKIGLAHWKALDWFQEMESVGWVDYRGRELVAWKPQLNRVRTKWEADGRPTAPPGRQTGTANGAETVIKGKELERVQAEINRIRNQYDAHQTMTGADRKVLGDLLARKKILKAELGVKV